MDNDKTNQPSEVSAPFWVGDWYVDPGSCRLKRGDKEVKIEPKVMTVLTCLADQAGKVISREQLEEQAWPGVIVGYDSLASTIIKLRKAFGDDSKNPQIIETVSKKGYRLIPAVKPADQSPVTAPNNLFPEIRAFNLFSLINQLAVSLLIIAIIWFVVKPAIEPGSTEVTQKPIIAVLPFKNLSNDPLQDYFSDGITADLITDLSKLSSLAVIARNSVFTYKNLDIDIRKVGSELGVNYVIEGSIRKSGDQLRISARLIDASNSLNIWADRFDGKLENVFALQDKVTASIISSLEIKLTEKERGQLARKYTNSIDAYDLFLHGWQNLWIASKDSNPVARDYFLQAIALDEQFARAYANLAITYIYDYMHGWSEHSEQSLERANYYSKRAIEEDPGLPQVHWARGFAEIFNRNYKAAINEAEIAIEHDPNFADGYGLFATALNYAGKPEKAIVEMEKAMQLNPGHPFIYKVIYGEILFNLHRYEDAINNFEKALNRNPELQEARLWLAASYAQIDRVEEAVWQLEQIRTADNSLSLDWIEKAFPLQDPVQRQHLLNALIKAGLQ